MDENSPLGTEFERYVEYIVSALQSDEDWRVHARRFLISLGDDPDELERESAIQEQEVRDTVAASRSSSIQLMPPSIIFGFMWTHFSLPGADLLRLQEFVDKQDYSTGVTIASRLYHMIGVFGESRLTPQTESDIVLSFLDDYPDLLTDWTTDTFFTQQLSVLVRRYPSGNPS